MNVDKIAKLSNALLNVNTALVNLINISSYNDKDRIHFEIDMKDIYDQLKVTKLNIINSINNELRKTD